MRKLIAPLMLLPALALAWAAQDSPTRAAAPAEPPAGAQPAAAKAAPLPKGPVLTGEDGQPIKGVRLAKADVKAIVDGPLAQTVMTLTFANDLPRVLGGELVFPLPEGATVSGYGLDVKGVMVDGVAVEKQRARIIYEQELHKSVDPGLVEHVAGNAFRTRLYPVPPNGTRTVRVRYETALGTDADQAGKASLTLPVGWADVVDKVSVRVELRHPTGDPVIAGAAGDQPGLKRQRTEQAAVIEGTVPTAAFGQGFTVVLPSLPKQSVSVERRLKAAATFDELEEQEKRDRQDAAKAVEQFEHFFVVTDTPEPAARKAAQLKQNRVGIVWDASLSRASADHARELKLLEQTLAKLGNPSVDVIVVRNNLEVRPFFASGKEAIEYIKGLAYDGATNLGALTFPKSVHAYPGIPATQPAGAYDLFLLFTDGMGNLGADMPSRIEAPICAISDADQVNHALLRNLCQQSGGAYFNLKSATDEQVVAGVGDMPFSVVSCEFDPKQVAEVYPGPGQAVRGRVVIAGKLLAPEAQVKVNYGYGKEVTHSERFTIKSDGAADGTLLPRYWAQQKVAELALFPEKNADELTKIGKQFNLVTPNTSLLVLETPDQYVQYRVVPPKSRPDVYREFLAKIEQNKVQEQQTKEQKIQQVLAMWNARVQWWEKEYKYPADLKVQPQEDKAGHTVLAAVDGSVSRGRGGAASGGLPAQSVSRPAAAAPGEAPAPLPSPSASSATPSDLTSADAASAPHPRPAAAEPAAQRPQQQAQQQQANRSVNDPQSRNPQAGQPEGRVRTEVEVLRQRRESARGGRFGAQLGDADSDGIQDRETTQLGRRYFAEHKGKDGGEGAADFFTDAAIAIKPWDPNTPYLRAMKAAPADQAYGVYLEQRKTFGRSPAFYLDCADYLVDHGQRDLGVRVLTDVAELQLQDARLLRVAAHRLMQIAERELAIDLFEKVLALRPEEPQSYRDLALALADRAQLALALDVRNSPGPSPATLSQAKADYGRALDLLNKVIVGTWPRFPEIELPVLMEANQIIATLANRPDLGEVPDPIDGRLRKVLDCDVRVVLTWDADQTDIDLWVTEPSNEKCFYGHNRTIIGGLISRDYTDGYGPEEYCLRKLMPGQYKIQANFYGSRQQELTGPATVQATVITHFGRPNEKRQALTIRLKNARDVVDIGTITLGPGGDATARPATQPAAAELNK